MRNQDKVELVALPRKKRKEGCVMKKILLATVVLIIATPVFAAVDVNCTCDGNEVTVRYVNTDPNHVRAFALDIILDNSDADITSVYGYDPCTDDYYIYPGSVVVDAESNSISSYGTPYADQSKYPDGTLPGPPDSNGMTIEMASLYYPTGHTSPNAPADANVLFKFKVNANTGVIIQQNTKRGGIVMEDANGPTSANLSGCSVTSHPCFDSDDPNYSEWLDVNEPNCWCYTYQCEGDADGLELGDSKAGYYYVEYQDLNKLIGSWKKTWGEAGFNICADFDRTLNGDFKAGYYRVQYEDLNILVANWKADAFAKGDNWQPGGQDPNCGGNLAP
jgi:hypothetical protein